MGVLLMTYYHTPTSTARNPGRLEQKLSDGYMIGPPEGGWTPELAAVCGFVVVVETAAPAVTASQVADSAVQLVNDVSTRVWTVRSKTQDELDADSQQANRATIEGRVTTLLGQLDTIAATSGTLTAAQLSGAVRQLAVGLRAVVRLQANRLDSAD